MTGGVRGRGCAIRPQKPFVTGVEMSVKMMSGELARLGAVDLRVAALAREAVQHGAGLCGGRQRGAGVGRGSVRRQMLPAV
jgi:hypothetical protein